MKQPIKKRNKVLKMVSLGEDQYEKLRAYAFHKHIPITTILEQLVDKSL